MINDKAYEADDVADASVAIEVAADALDFDGVEGS